MLKLSDELLNALQAQVKLEMEAFYTYHALAVWLESRNWHYASKFYEEQSQEEFAHAKEFEKFLIDMGRNVEFFSLDAPPSEYPDVKTALQAVLDHEIKVSKAIEKLYEIAVKNDDHYAIPLIQRFLEEQIEEVAIAAEILERYDHFGGNDLYWDHRMKKKDLGE
ncbi:MAG: ferritin [Methanobacteriota archaeon]|nr:MAG: ferritin [Euryarchaeota archaeon]